MIQNTFYNKDYVSKKDFPSLLNDIDCDIVIVGAGLAGLALSYELSCHGVKVVVIDANRIGTGASGINGGFCSSGWSAHLSRLYKKYGYEVTNILEKLSLEGLNWVQSFENHIGFERIDLKSGILNLSLLKSEKVGRELFEKKVQRNNTDEFVPKNELKNYVVSDIYNYGVLSPEGFHFNPLEFLNGLKVQVHERSVQIFENTKMVGFYEYQAGCHVQLESGGVIRCKKLVLAAGGYGGPELGSLRSYWLPIRTFIATTSPLGPALSKVIRKDLAFNDDRRAGNYFRVVGNQRLLWGRGISAFGSGILEKLDRNVRKDIQSFFPILVEEIGGVEMLQLDYKWSGKMAYSFNMMPYVGKLSERVFSLTGFGGHGMNTAPIAAIVLAEYLLGMTDRISIFKKIPMQWNGWMFGGISAEVIYKLLQVKDQFHYLKSKYY